MDFQATYDVCVKAFKERHVIGDVSELTNIPGVGINVWSRDFNQIVVTAHDVFEATRWYFKLETGEYVHGKMEDPIRLSTDKEFIAYNDVQRREQNRYSYPHLERMYGYR